MHRTDITLDNYGAILQNLNPLLRKYMSVWSRKFGCDIGDIEEIVGSCLFNAITLYKKDKGSCKFTSYFLTHIKHTLYNEARDTYAERVLKDNGQFSQPCSVCFKNDTCTTTCFKAKKYEKCILTLNTLRSSRNRKNFTDSMEEQDHTKKLIKFFLKKHPKCRELINEIKNELKHDTLTSHDLAKAVRNISKRRAGCISALYNQINRMRKWLEQCNTELLRI